jgi:hypothetical protein
LNSGHSGGAAREVISLEAIEGGNNFPSAHCDIANLSQLENAARIVRSSALSYCSTDISQHNFVMAR